MKSENKNTYFAIALSLVVVLAWNFFYAGPQMAKQHQQQAQVAAVTAVKDGDKEPKQPGAVGALPQPSVNAPPQGGVAPQTPQAAKSREAALADSPRIKIDTPKLFGSIALKGARVDDIALKDYRETPDPNSPNIVLLSPANAPVPYYAESGYVPQPGTKPALPNADTLWSADSQTLTPAKPVALTWDNGQGLIFHRTVAIDDNYMLTLSDRVENKTASPVTLYPYSLILRQGLPPTSGYSVLHEGYIGYIGDNGEQQITYSGIDKETNATKSLKGTGGWIGFTDKYWAAALIPDQGQSFDGSFSSRGTGAQKIFQTDTLGTALTVPANGSAEESSRIFAGAKVVSQLNAYEKTLGIRKLDLLIDWGWFWFITQPMFDLLDGIYKVVGNFGLAIIAITFLVKAVFYPLANRSYVSMAKMKAAQPQLAALKERYPDDKMKQQQEMMAIYKREKINPVAGCLPMLIQIPVFFSLYKVLFVTIEMRQAPFFGWIHDLSQPDPTNIFNLFGLLPYNPTSLPLIGHFLAIGIWPLIMGFSMFLQMKMNPAPADPVQKTMFAWMPVIFTFMLGTFPSGLVIYWTINNTLTVIQQSIITKRAGGKLELWDNLTGLFRRRATT